MAALLVLQKSVCRKDWGVCRRDWTLPLVQRLILLSFFLWLRALRILRSSESHIQADWVHPFPPIDSQCPSLGVKRFRRCCVLFLWILVGAATSCVPLLECVVLSHVTAFVFVDAKAFWDRARERVQTMGQALTQMKDHYLIFSSHYLRYHHFHSLARSMAWLLSNCSRSCIFWPVVFYWGTSRRTCHQWAWYWSDKSMRRCPIVCCFPSK